MLNRADISLTAPYMTPQVGRYQRPTETFAPTRASRKLPSSPTVASSATRERHDRRRVVTRLHEPEQRRVLTDQQERERSRGERDAA
jgi:hypothetical protein